MGKYQGPVEGRESRGNWVRAFIAASMGKMGKAGLVFKIILAGSGAQGLSWAVQYLTLGWLGQEKRGSNPSVTKGQHEDIPEARRLLALKVIAQEPQLSLWIWKHGRGRGLDTEAVRVKGPARMCKRGREAGHVCVHIRVCVGRWWVSR